MRELLLVVAIVTTACTAPPAPVEPPRTEPHAPSTPPPEPVEPAPIAEVAPPTPRPLDPSGRGDACDDDAGCGYDDACLPQRCVAAATAAPAATACDESGPPPGECECVDRRCLLRPHTPPPPTDEGCKIQHCGLDEGAGRCVVGAMLEANRFTRDAGSLCTCDFKTSRCTFEWVAPIACTSAADCWVSDQTPWHPIARPKKLRGRTFKPCRDGEHAPACKDGRCTLLAYTC